jgi:hypothetical protein
MNSFLLQGIDERSQSFFHAIKLPDPFHPAQRKTPRSDQKIDV